MLQALPRPSHRVWARYDLGAYGAYAHLDDCGRPLGPAEHHRRWIELLCDDTIKRVLLIAPPGHAKSTWASILYPAWLVGRRPDVNIILVSNTAEQAHLFSVAVRGTIEANEAHREVFPHLRPDRTRGWSESEWFVQRSEATNKDSTMTALGVGGPIIGRRANLIIADDPCDQENTATEAQREKLKAWFRQSLLSRLNPGGRVVVIVTRWHHDDLAADLIASGDYTVVHMPAINERGEALWPERFPLERLERTRREVGTRVFEAMYQGRPTPGAGVIFKREWFGPFAGRAEYEVIGQAWDTALKTHESSDYSACVTLGLRRDVKEAHVLDVWRGKVEAPDLQRRMRELYLAWRPAWVAVEDTMGGTAAMQYIKREALLPLVPVRVDRDKVTRANAVAPYCEGGHVRLRAGAPWIGEFLDELCAFPHGAHDDMTDAFVHGMTRLIGASRAVVAVWA